MDPESKKLLQDTFDLTKENNKILRNMRRSQKISTFITISYWVVIVGISIGAFYFLQPYIGQVQNFIKESGDSINQLKNVGNYLPKK